MAKPMVVLVHGHTGTRVSLGKWLRRRFGADYQVAAADAATAALDLLGRQERAHQRVALLLADHALRGSSGVELLSQAHALHPAAKRLLLVPYGDAAGGLAALQAVALGQIDDWLNTPYGPPEQRLYPVVSELLGEWARATTDTGSALELVRILAPRWSARSHELRDLLSRNNIPHGFYDTDQQDGRRMLAHLGLPDSEQPVLLLADGRILVDPATDQLALALGAKTHPTEDRYDVAVVGAGPAGLAAATYAASEGLSTVLIEREATGGQAGTTSQIRNYLGFPRGISGGELAARAAEQAVSFGTELVYAQPATRLQPEGVDRVLTLADGSQAVSRTVVIATGVTYRRLPVPGLDTLLGAGVFYGAAVTEARAMQGRHVVVVGGANSAGQAAVHLSRHAERVTLVVRGDSLDSGMSAYLVQELARAGNIAVQLNAEVVEAHGTGRLSALTLRNNRTGGTTLLPTTAAFILIGAEPHTDWLDTTLLRDDRGFILTGHDLLNAGGAERKALPNHPPLPLETSLPGVFAAGDVRHGSVKRVAAAVGEGATAIHLIHHYLGQPAPPRP